MPRCNARKVLENQGASREEVGQAIAWLDVDLQYIFKSLKDNPAQETQDSIKESLELLEQLKAKLATLE